MHRILILGAVGLIAAGAGVTRLVDLERRLTDLDESRLQAPRERLALQEEMDRMRVELGAIAEMIDALEAEDDGRVEGLVERFTQLEAAVTRAADAIEVQASEVEDLAARDQDTERSIETRIMAIESEIAGRWQGLSEVVNAAAHLAQETSEGLHRIDSERHSESDHGERWRSIVGPTVQLAGDTTVGSGVILRSQPARSGEGHETLLVTAWHVVRDIRADANEDNPPIPVAIYSEDGSIQHETARLLHFDAAIDAALLSMNTEKPVTFGARIPAREHMQEIRIFHPIYAVGCPLGNDPIPTAGEVADLTHSVDGGEYWMISAPTYIGNSGGGVYDAETHELLGIFSKIYTHGHMRPTVVPHMGLVVSIDRIYDWLEGEGYGRIVQAGDGVGMAIELELQPLAQGTEPEAR